MRRTTIQTILMMGILFLAACGRTDVTRTVSGVAAAEADSIRDIMLSVAEPDEAISFFRNAAKESPDSLEDQRGLGRSLVRAGRLSEAVAVWRDVVRHPDTRPEDDVALADALIRTSDWTAAKGILDQVPPDHASFDRYKLEAMIADSRQQWDKADSFYQTAADMTAAPALILNNWGYSKLSRGDMEAAERLFIEALTHDDALFTAKINLVLSRAARRTYTMPLIRMTAEEHARLLHTAGLAAIKRGDIGIGQGLLEESLLTHPRHFEPAAKALAALNI
jgi:Flp pilus assembly protein TadD